MTLIHFNGQNMHSIIDGKSSSLGAQPSAAVSDLLDMGR